MQIIPLTAEDDIISVCDRLDWSDEKRVLFVLPPPPILPPLSLIRLRRYADRKRIEVGLVTTSRQLARQAQAAGLPAFASVAEAETSRRGWWRGRRRQERLGLPTYGEPLDDGKLRWKDAVDNEEPLPAPVVTPRQWFLRYAGILLFFTAGALLAVLFLYLVPRATITLKPELRPLTATQQITAVPDLAAVDNGRAAIPARRLTLTQSWKTEIEATGIVEVPTTPARGRIIFTNVTSETVAIPAGTIIRANDGRDIAFQTVEEVVVVGVAGGTAETDAIALKPGPQGNVARETITILSEPLAERVEVRNPAPMVGGAVQAVTAVSEADIARLRSQALQFLQAVALSEMETQITEREFLARESLRVVEILSERFSHAVGEQTERLGVEMEAALQGTAVDTTAASGLVYDALARQVTPGFSLVPDSIRFGESQVVSADEAGNVTFLMTGEGMMAIELDLAADLKAIAGQETETAVAYLNRQLPLQAPPEIEIRPLWFHRLPYLTSRIQANIQPGE